MNILHVVPYYAPAFGFGGPIQSSLRIATALQAEDHRLAVLSTDVSGSGERLPSGWDEERNLPIYRVKNASHAIARRYKVFLPLTKPETIRERLFLPDFDVVHMQEYRNMLNVTVSEACRGAGVPYVLSPRGTLPQEHGRTTLSKGFDAMVGDRLLKDASACIALTPREREQLEGFGVPSEKIRIVPNAVPDVEPAEDPEGFLQEHGIPEDAHRILFLARLHPVKGLDRALEAVGNVSEEHDVHLVIVGPEEALSVEALIEEHGVERSATYCGPLYGSKKSDAYASSDLYTLPSRMEGFPNTILEAMSFGLPIVASDACNVAEVIEDECGFVTSTQDELEASIKRLVHDEGLKHRMGARARELAGEEFSTGRIVNLTREVYEAAARDGAS